MKGTRFLTQKPDTDPDHGDKLLYIACSQTAAPSGCPEAAFSAGVLQAAAPSCHQPNILLTGTGDTPGRPAESYMSGKSLDACQVFNAIQEVIFRHYRLKLKREELFQSLHSDNGIEGMAHVAHTFLGNPVTICDTSFSVIAASPVVKDADNLEEKHGRLYLKDPLFQNMADRNIIRHIYSSAVPYITTLDDYPVSMGI